MKRLGIVLAFFTLLLAAPTSAQLGGGLMFPGPGMPAASGGGSLSIAWQSSTGTITTPAPPWTPSALATGTLGATTVVVAVVSYLGSGAGGGLDQVSAVTFNGSAATLAVDGYTASGRLNVSVWYKLVTSGTTVTVGVGGYSNGQVSNLTINIGVITGSATASVASTVNSQIYPTGGSAMVTVPTNGRAVLGYVCATNATAGSVAPTWSGGGVTDGSTPDGAGGNAGGALGHLAATATIAPTNVQANYGGAQGWVSASFQP